MVKRFIYILLTLVIVLPGKVSGQEFYELDYTLTRSVSSSSYDEMAPVPLNDSVVYFLSSRPSSSAREITTAEGGKNMANIYSFTMEKDERTGKLKYGIPKPVKSLNTQYFDGPLDFNNNGELICFARMWMAEPGASKSNGNTKLKLADRQGEEWMNIRDFEHNDPQFSLTTPCFSPDGQLLYFAADFSDSKGGFDIYVSSYQNGNWSTPVNAGDMINTEEDELFPSLHSSGRLYFSSKGHDASGFDIFYCDRVNDEWTDARALTWFNRRSDDYSIIMSDDYTSGWFTRIEGSSRKLFRYYTPYPPIGDPQKIKKNRWKYKLRENSLDTIDYTIFEYEWVINDTLRLPGHEVIYAFPRPGDYFLSFNVTNKVTDTIMYGVGTLMIPIREIEQGVITCPKTVRVGETVSFSAAKTHMPDNFTIEGYYWDFADGMKAEGLNVDYQYQTAGTYKVVLSVKGTVRTGTGRGNKYEEIEEVFKEITVLPVE